MKKGKKFNHLGRDKGARKALLKNLSAQLILSKRIFTTVAKAKALRTFVEPILTRSKDDSTHSRRSVFSVIPNKKVIKELFGEIARVIANRKGGYCRIVKMQTRFGDNAKMCFIELVDYNKDYIEKKK